MYGINWLFEAAFVCILLTINKSAKFEAKHTLHNIQQRKWMYISFLPIIP